MKNKFLTKPLQIGLFIAAIVMIGSLFRIWDKIESPSDWIEALVGVFTIGISCMGVWLIGVRISIMPSLRRLFVTLACFFGILLIHFLCAGIFSEGSILSVLMKGDTLLGAIFLLTIFLGESALQKK